MPHAVGGRPPVEHRLLGLDRRTFKLPLCVVALFVVWVFIAPAVNDALEYDQPVLAGDAFIIAPGVTMAPPVGWSVQAGVRERDRSRSGAGPEPQASFSGDGITVTTKAGSFRGNARELNVQVANVNEQFDTSDAFTIDGKFDTITLDGRHGVVRRFSGPRDEGAIFTFVQDGTGLEIVISGEPNALVHQVDEIARMIASVDFDSQDR